MELAPQTAVRYLDVGFDRLQAVVDRVGDPKLNERPITDHTNSISALVAHCCGVAEFWLGHVGLGRPSHRDRPAELVHEATVGELHALLAVARAKAADDVMTLVSRSVPGHPDRQHLVDETDAALVLHVLEELFQHVGHAEITADALLATS